MKICMLGSGALGSVIGGALTEAGFEVYLIRRSPDHVQIMNSQGLKLREGGSDRIVKVRAVTDCRDIGPVDLIIVLVKAYDTREAIEQALPIIGDETVILSLQNGLGAEDIIAERVGKEHILGGRTYVAGMPLGPGHMIAGIKGKRTVMGELDGSITERVNRIAEAFNRAGMETIISGNIIGLMWDKLLINVATGALSGMTRLSFGGLYQVQEIRDCAIEAVAEAMAVAKASGVTLETVTPEEAWLKAPAGLPGEFKASILQSLEKGVRTEIDFINGSVVRWGEKCGVPTPVNKTLVAGVKGIEYWMTHYAEKQNA